jgi:predicted TIM-barrel fold metal-dependent hydrolase
MIDAHAHFLPPALAEVLKERRLAPNIAADDDGSVSIGIYRTRIPYDRAFDDLEARLTLMEDLGIYHQVLSLPGLFGIDSLPADEAGDLAGHFNEGTADVVRRHPDRFTGIASLPIADPLAAVREYRRAREELGLAGMILPGDAFVSLAQAQHLRPLFRVAQEIGGLIFIHPGPLPSGVQNTALDAPAPHGDNIVHRRVTADIQSRLTEVMITLALSDYLDEFDDVPVQVANLGGALPFVLERMDHVYAIRHPDLPLPSESLKPVYVDSASMGPKALELAVEVYGADRILFGTDNPIFDDRRGIAAVENSRLSQADKQKIFTSNSQQLLRQIAP